MDGFTLTHAEWHNGYGCCYETGVRPTGSPDDFELIQHGWGDFRAAERLILRALKKGWDAHRIFKVMDFLKHRRRVKPTFI